MNRVFRKVTGESVPDIVKHTLELTHKTIEEVPFMLRQLLIDLGTVAFITSITNKR